MQKGGRVGGRLLKSSPDPSGSEGYFCVLSNEARFDDDSLIPTAEPLSCSFDFLHRWREEAKDSTEKGMRFAVLTQFPNSYLQLTRVENSVGMLIQNSAQISQRASHLLLL